MSEQTSQVKAGEMRTYHIGGKVLALAPVPLGRLKAILNGFKEQKANDVAEIFGSYLLAVLEPQNKDKGLSVEFFLEHVSLPLAKEIMGEFAVMNGLPNFFQGLMNPSADAMVKAEKELIEAPKA